MKIVALIGARSGSSLKDKNIKTYNGKPLLIHSIEQAEASKYISGSLWVQIVKIMLELLKNILMQIIIRPIELSGDYSN